MIVYNEEKHGQQSVFIKNVLDADGNITSSREVVLRLYQVENGGFLYFILYDDSMKPIPSFFQYLNFGLRGSPLTSRSKAAFALRLLYCFLSLSGYHASFPASE